MRAIHLAILLFLLPTAVAEAVQEARYVAPGGSNESVDSPAGRIMLAAASWDPVGDPSLGGANFEAGRLPRSLVAIDDAGGTVGLTACQDEDGGTFCEPDEPFAEGCGAVTLPDSFRADLPVFAFVNIRLACPDVATTGTLRLFTD